MGFRPEAGEGAVVQVAVRAGVAARVDLAAGGARVSDGGEGGGGKRTRRTEAAGLS
jgi:hypothetical protein